MVSNKNKGKLNPADQFRKDQKKKQIKRNKKLRDEKRATTWGNRDDSKIKSQIEDLEDMASRGVIDTQGNQRLKTLKDTHAAILRAKKAAADKSAAAASSQAAGPQLGKVVGLSAITGKADPVKEEKEKAKEAKKISAQYGYENPEDSPYYHPTHNPHGIPPAGHAAASAQLQAESTSSGIEIVGLKEIAPAPTANPGPPPGAPPGPPPGAPPGPPPGAPPGLSIP